MLRTRLATAAIGLPAVAWIVMSWSSRLFAGFIMTVTWIALFEYFHMALPDHPRERWAGMLYGFVVAAGVATGRPALWGAGLAFTVMVGLGLSLTRAADLSGAVQRLGLSVLGVIYVGFFVPHMVLLRGSDGSGWRWLLFTAFVAMGSDSGGYFVGGWLGRTKLLPAVSPSKTVEGAAGSVAGAMVIALACRLVFHPDLGVGEAVGLGAAISVLAQLGDLCESALKRAFGAKDSGWIIPGHGGILDRLDSLLFPMVFAYYYSALARG